MSCESRQKANFEARIRGERQYLEARGLSASHLPSWDQEGLTEEQKARIRAEARGR